MLNNCKPRRIEKAGDFINVKYVSSQSCKSDDMTRSYTQPITRCNPGSPANRYRLPRDYRWSSQQKPSSCPPDSRQATSHRIRTLSSPRKYKSCSCVCLSVQHRTGRRLYSINRDSTRLWRCTRAAFLATRSAKARRWQSPEGVRARGCPLGA